MNKETITIEIPVLDTQESFDLVNTFNEEQMKYVAVICKGYEKEVQKANKQKEVLDKIKEISNQVKEEALEVENKWTYQVMKEIDHVLEEIK